MDAFAKLVKLAIITKQEREKFDAIERGVEDGTIDPADALDMAHDVGEETEALLKGIDTKQFMLDRMQEAVNYE